MAPFKTDDLDLSLEMWTDPAVVRYSGAVMSESEIREKLPDWTRRGADGYIGIWTVSDRRTGEKFGSAALLPMPVEEGATDFSLVVPGEIPAADIEIGYYLKRPAWGFGYATEACRRLLQFVFEATPLIEVVATFHAENLASRKVLERLGFTDHGMMQCYGGNGINFRITRDEWSGKCSEK